jgi:hypothetical protein
MADKRITALTELAYANMAAEDVVAIEDITAGNTMKAELADLKQYMLENKTIGGTTAGDIADISTAQTFTNKRLTSPLLNEAVAVTTTATEVNLLHGYTGNTADLNVLAGVAAAGVTPTEIGYLNGVTSAIQTQLGTIPAVDGRTWTYGDGFTTSATSEVYAATDIITAVGLNSANWIMDPTTVIIQVYDVGATYTYPPGGSVTFAMSLTTAGGQTYVNNITLAGLTHGPNNYSFAITFKVVAKA